MHPHKGSKKPEKQVRGGVITNDHSYFVITTRELVILLISAPNFMDFLLKMQAEAEEDMVALRTGEPTAPG